MDYDDPDIFFFDDYFLELKLSSDIHLTLLLTEVIFSKFEDEIEVIDLKI